jgi:gas vesicle protein
MTQSRSEYSGGNGFLIGLITGGAIGAALAIAYGPRVADVRRRVSASAADLGDTATQAYKDVSARVAGAVDGLTAKGQSVRDDVADAIVDGARHVEQFAMAAKTVPTGRRSS